MTLQEIQNQALQLPMAFGAVVIEFNSTGNASTQSSNKLEFFGGA